MGLKFYSQNPGVNMQVHNINMQYKHLLKKKKLQNNNMVQYSRTDEWVITESEVKNEKHIHRISC